MRTLIAYLLIALIVGGLATLWFMRRRSRHRDTRHTTFDITKD